MLHFEYFPKIEYSDNKAVNITVRAKIREAILAQTALFYKYTIRDGVRPDILATKYYGNPNETWAIFYANDIFDPRFDWPLDDKQFYAYIKSKYGSVEKAQSQLEKPKYYLLDGIYKIDEKTFLDPTVEGVKTKVTHYEHEWELNEKKRDIIILDSAYLINFVNELENIFK